MGTRNLTIIVVDKEVKVAQYGQFDGYPEGLGQEMMHVVKDTDLEVLKEQVRKCTFMTDEEVEALPEATWSKTHPQLSRNTRGQDLIDLIMKSNDGLPLQNHFSFAGDGLFCEWAYVIDLDKGKYECYEGFNKKPVGPRSIFASLNALNEGGYYPPKKVFQASLEDVKLYTDEDISNFGSISMKDFRKAVKLRKFVETE